jgi:hypothetical protein
MTKLQLIDIETFINQTKNCILIFGDTTSILTRSVFTLLKDLGYEICIIDTEENLEAYAKYRIRTTPLIHVYTNSELTCTFTLPLNKEDVKRCLI